MAQTESTMAALGMAAPDFALPDTGGRTVALGDFADAPGLLVAFICNHCPFVIHLHRQFNVTTLEGFGYTDFDASLQAAGAVLAYLHETQKVDSTHISAIRRREPSDFVQIDPHSWRSLEVERTLRAASTDGTLLAAVNRTVSAMGQRRLREALRFPLRRAPGIVARHNAVAELLDDPTRLKALRQLLRDISDIERITARLGLGRCSPRDLQTLGRSLDTVASLQRELRSADAELLGELCGALGGLEELSAHLLSALSSEAPLTVREGFDARVTGWNPRISALLG